MNLKKRIRKAFWEVVNEVKYFEEKGDAEIMSYLYGVLEGFNYVLGDLKKEKK